MTIDSSRPIASISVAANSEAGNYGRQIHDERYKTWQDLGVGSRSKPGGGQGVGEKFIERAIAANGEKVGQAIDHELRKAEL